jgi:hypothetical protein
VGLVWQSAQEGLPQLLGGNRCGREGKTANSSPNKVLTWPRCVCMAVAHFCQMQVALPHVRVTDHLVCISTDAEAT